MFHSTNPQTMIDLLKQLTDEKAKIQAKITTLKGEIWDLNLQSKKIDKAITALTPDAAKKENDSGKAPKA